MDSKEFYDFLLKIHTISKIGLTYSKDEYALSNYKEINDLSKNMLENFLNVKFDRPSFFQRDIYPTPNVSVRSIILNKERNKVLMVREVVDHGYSFPGGWADLYDSPTETAIKEAKQEAGADIKIIRLVGIMNRTPFKKPTAVPEYVIIFEAELIDELHEHEYETDDVNFFDVNNLPQLSLKVTEEEIKRMLFAAINKEIIFD